VAVPATKSDMPSEQKTTGEFLHWINRCNNGLSNINKYIPFRVHGIDVGYLDPTFAGEHLTRFPDIFYCSKAEVRLATRVENIRDLHERSSEVSKALVQLRDDGIITGWRDELYPVLTSFESSPVLLMERAASVHFGIKAYGVHVNGYVEREDGGLDMWVARRSASKPTWPGRLDHIVAGGQPHGISPTKNVIKECQEEAGIEDDLAKRAVPVGAVSYCSEYSYGLKRDVLFCYDLKLPRDFVPVAVDGEVEEFYRLRVEDVMDIVRRRDGDVYKDNCNLVLLDFFVRHGYITPDNTGYLDIVRGLRPSQELQ
jgi:isopentenyldiphosphate isomerase